ncbi:hypothetical protein MHBO_001587 [Bonamia ostreae]|uniref:SMP-LTD domain-containing protein n=1 Tax=Bonamia ostreae TaxID=126728 RepID=A0ABV2AJL7_9EUKA
MSQNSLRFQLEKLKNVFICRKLEIIVKIISKLLNNKTQMATLKIILFSIFVYFITAYSGFSTLLLLILLILLYDQFLAETDSKKKISQTNMIDYLSSCPKPPKNDIPKWLMFPEYEKARFINHIIYVLWNPHLKLSIEEKIRAKLDWKLEVQKNKYKKLSHLSVNVFDLGSSPPLVSGIKTCEVKCDMCSRHIVHDYSECDQKYCALQIEFVFVSEDMKFGLTAGYKNIKATVILSKIYLSGSVLLKLCDFVNLIPGFSRYTLSFLNYPKFDFALSFKTGSIKISYVPKLSKIIEPLLKKTIWTGLIYPRSKSFKIKSRKIEQMRAAGDLIKYGQLSTVTEGSLCVEIKEVVWDTPAPKEPDYAVPLMLERGSLYQDDLGYSWHCVVGVKGTRMVYKTEHIQSKYVTRRLKWTERFTFKNLTLSDPRNISVSPFLDIDVRVLGKSLKYFRIKPLFDY